MNATTDDVQCAACGYLLRGLAEDVRCPECGGADRWTSGNFSGLYAAQRRVVLWGLALLVVAHLVASVGDISEFMYWRQALSLNRLVFLAFFIAGVMEDVLTAIAGWCIFRASRDCRRSRVIVGLRAGLAVATIGCMISGAMGAFALTAPGAILSAPIVGQVGTVLWVLFGSSKNALVACVLLLLAWQLRDIVSRAARYSAFVVVAIYGALLVAGTVNAALLAYGRGLESVVGAYVVRVAEESSAAVSRVATFMSASLLVAVLIWMYQLRTFRCEPSASIHRGHETISPG